jgi:hypothetical protein
MLSIPDATGDTRIMWDPSDSDEVDAARAAFNTAKAKGMLAYTVDPDDPTKHGEVIRKFDATRGKIIMAKQTAGG